MDILIIGLILFVIFDVILVFYILRARRKCKFTSAQQTYFQSHWEKIINSSQVDVKPAILEADKLLDQGLKLKGYSGSLGEKLKKSGKLFRNLNDIWYAHKTRNNIAHELNFQISPSQGQKVLKIFCQALHDLGVKLS